MLCEGHKGTFGAHLRGVFLYEILEIENIEVPKLKSVGRQSDAKQASEV